MAGEDTRKLGQILLAWDFRDDVDSPAPTIFQLVYRNFVQSVFESNLEPEAARLVLDKGNYWEERLQQMVLDGSSRWLEKTLAAKKVSSVDALFRQAAVQAAEELSRSHGSDSRGRFGPDARSPPERSGRAVHEGHAGILVVQR